MFVLLLALCVLPGIQIAPRGQFHETAFSREQTRSLKGVFALAVLLHHLCAYLSVEFRSLVAFQYVGFISIGAFFFISGYGLICRADENPHYLRGFFRGRVLTVLFPYYVINVFYCLINCVGQNLHTALRYILRSLLGLHLWYVPVILLLYGMFYLAFRFLPKQYALPAVTAATVLYIAGMYCLYRFGGFGAYGFWWYNSAIAFPLGMWYGRYKNSLHRLVQKKYPLWALGTFAGFVAVYCWICPRHNDGTLPVLLMQILCVILFCQVLAILSQKIHIDNPCLRFLGNHSFEIYLWHALFIALFRSGYTIRLPFAGPEWPLFVESGDLYVTAILAATFIASWAVHRLCGRILKRTK
jgi:peptidoglycan/LPS O-acetylase OafA/YrhL